MTKTKWILLTILTGVIVTLAVLALTMTTCTDDGATPIPLANCAPQELDTNSQHSHGTFVPERVSGNDKVEADIASDKGVEITVNMEDGDAIVFFDPDSFAEQAELRVSAEVQAVSTFFGTATAGLNLPDDTIELSRTIEVKRLSGNADAVQRVRISLPFNDAVEEADLKNYDIVAIFSAPLKEGGVTTTTLGKKTIDYNPKGLVTFWTEGVPLEAAIVGIPK